MCFGPRIGVAQFARPFQAGPPSVGGSLPVARSDSHDACLRMVADITGMGEEIRVGRRCFVSNLAWRTSWQDLKDEFRKCGTVVYSNVMRDESNRSKGWGIVEFETAEEAVTAMNTMNGVEIHGRPIIVREDREDREIKDFSKPFGGRAFSAGLKKEGEDVPPGTQVSPDWQTPDHYSVPVARRRIQVVTVPT